MHPRRSGFTLIELLVVIAIIAILAAILFPVFARVKRRAAESVCLGNLKQIGAAIMMYVDDNHGRYPLRPQGALRRRGIGSELGLLRLKRSRLRGDVRALLQDDEDMDVPVRWTARISRNSLQSAARQDYRQPLVRLGWSHSG